MEKWPLVLSQEKSVMALESNIFQVYSNSVNFMLLSSKAHYIYTYLQYYKVNVSVWDALVTLTKEVQHKITVERTAVVFVGHMIPHNYILPLSRLGNKSAPEGYVNLVDMLINR